ncbi:hypothetical protein B0A50_05561, partial [Salinomyces thailandicus]
METINKLLSRPSTKRRTRAEILRDRQLLESEDLVDGEGGAEGTAGEGGAARLRSGGGVKGRAADPLFTRYVQGREGWRGLGVPGGWLEG